MSQTGFFIYRRNLPHWRLTGATYFVTWRLHRGQRALSANERSTVVEALRFFEKDRYDLFAYAVMDDHVHVLVHPRDEHQLHHILHSWKSFAASRLQRESGRRGVVWQDESWDRIVRDEREFWNEVRHISNNPRKRWERIEDYPWVWVMGMSK